jgi:PadR family transcriptional regulator
MTTPSTPDLEGERPEALDVGDPGAVTATSPSGDEAVAQSLRKFNKELSSGIVSLALLGLMAHADKPLYGYQVAKELEGFGEGLPVKQGTLYPVLRSLEAGGLLTSEVEPSVTGPPRRYYSVTEEGRQAIVQWRQSWTRTREFVDSVLEGDRG